MEISVVIKGVISLFIIMLIGVYGAKRNIITSTINKGLTDILLNITLPLLVITSFCFTYDEALKQNVYKSFYYSFFTFIITGIFSYLILFPIKSDKKNILQFANVFSNCGFIGFPIINSIYGAEGVIYTSVYNMFFSIFLWTYGVMLFTGNKSFKEFKKVLLSPSVIAVYIGIVIMIFDIKIPEVLFSSMKTVGGMTSPLSLIIVGVILAKVNIKEMLNHWTLLIGILSKLIFIPLLLLAIAKIIGDSSKVAYTMVLLGAMPAAAMTSILAESFDKEKNYATILVFLTTLLSIITFPIIVMLVNF